MSEGKDQVAYASNVGKFTIFRRPITSHVRPGLNADGYGSKISTDYMIKFEGVNRLFRVYTYCHSNVAVYFIFRRGVRLHVRDVEFDTHMAPDPEK